MNPLLVFEKVRFFATLPKQIRLLLRLFRDVRVPLALKVLSALVAVLAISPLDPLADVPFIGALDDAALLTLIATAFIRFCPPLVVREHKAAVGLALPLKNITPR